MLRKLQQKTLIKSQLLAYVLALIVGTTLLMVIFQLYKDVKPILKEQTDVFSSKYAVISKNISAFKTFNKESIYFTPAQQEALRRESFVKNVVPFTVATFKIGAFTTEGEGIPLFYTDLFFESIPNKYLDINPENWLWDSTRSFVPIIIPENYLSLYNFGFAESQGLPVFSKGMISQIPFQLRLSGNGKEKTFSSHIVGFSSKINSILVPEDFLMWANQTYGTPFNRCSRLLIEFHDPSEQRILAYFNEHNYTINKDELELSKMSFFFTSALWGIVGIAVLIILLAIGIILLSINLIMQRNKEQITSLFIIGYTPTEIARYYQWVITLVTLIGIGLSFSLSYYLRILYMKRFESLFSITSTESLLSIIALTLMIFFILFFHIMIVRMIKNIVTPKKHL